MVLRLLFHIINPGAQAISMIAPKPHVLPGPGSSVVTTTVLLRPDSFGTASTALTW